MLRDRWKMRQEWRFNYILRLISTLYWLTVVPTFEQSFDDFVGNIVRQTLF